VCRSCPRRIERIETFLSTPGRASDSGEIHRWNRATHQVGNLTAVKGGTAKTEDSYTYDGTGLRQTQTVNGTKTNLTWDTAEELPLIRKPSHLQKPR